jgi:type II secretory pathway component PulK
MSLKARAVKLEQIAVTREWLINTNTLTGELLWAVFSIWSMPRIYKDVR